MPDHGHIRGEDLSDGDHGLSFRIGGTRGAWVTAALAAVVLALVWAPRSRWGTSDRVPSADEGHPHYPTDKVPATAQLLPSVLSITDAVEVAGDWFLLDERGKQVHHVSPPGVLLGSWGIEGSGPGEFTSPEAIVARADTVFVLERTGVLHRFDLHGTYLGDRRVPVSLCPGPGMVDLVSVESHLMFLAVCAGPDGGLTAIIVRESGEGAEIVASKTASVTGRKLDPFFLPVLSPYADGALFGLASEPCLEVLASGGNPVGSICHASLGRVRIPDDVQKQLDGLARRAAGVGRAVARPEYLPPFDGVFPADSVRVVYRVPSEKGSDLRRLTALDSQGERSLGVPEANYLFMSRSAVLAGWAGTDGTRIAFYRVPVSW